MSTSSSSISNQVGASTEVIVLLVDANGVVQNELSKRGVQSIDDLDDGEVCDMVRRFAVWIPQSVFIQTPWLAPFAVRRNRFRIDSRVEGEKRDLWGFPDESGYFTDDNSLIKGVFKGQRVSPSSSPYGLSVLQRGMWCCHVWASTTDNPLLFSFVPNLVWLPVSLAKYSDNHTSQPPHPAHEMLKTISLERFGDCTTNVARARVALAWSQLRVLPPDHHAPNESVHCEFSDSERVVSLVKKRLIRICDFLDGLIDGSCSRPPRFSKRYHAAAGSRIDLSVPPVDAAVPIPSLKMLREELNQCRI